MSLLSYTYAAFALSATVSAIAALARGRAGGLRGALQFTVSAPAIHAAPLLLAMLTGFSVAAWVLDDSRSPLVQAGIAATAIAIVLLMWLERRAAATATALTRALHEACDGGIQGQIAPARRHLRLSIRPWNVLPRTVDYLPDLRYGTTSERHVLDLYRLRGGASGSPVLLALHGGAWVLGHKRIFSNAIIGRVAEAGWLVVAVNYRLGPRHRLPDALVDVKRAIAWIRSEAGRYGGDPEFVLACGESAGGHLAAMAALTANRPEYQPGFERVDTSLCGVVPIYARLDLTDRAGAIRGERLRRFMTSYVMPRPYEDDPGGWEMLSPVACIHPGMPPMFVLHGTHDTIIPIEEAEYFVREARTISRAPVAFAALAGAQHAYELANSRWTRPTADAILAFGNSVFARQQATRSRGQALRHSET